jgi:hypothetical protein
MSTIFTVTHYSGFPDAGHLPKTLTDQYAAYILIFETLGSADCIPLRKTPSDNFLAARHVFLCIPTE